MKKYYIADLLTILEVILAGVLVYLGLHPELSPGIAALVIRDAELCDAFDGIAARLWPYPHNSKKYPWRKFAPLYDILSDLLLGAVAVWYIIAVVLPRSHWLVARIFLILLVAMVSAAITVEIITIFLSRHGRSAEADRIAVWRRRLIYIPAVVIVIAYPLLASGWNPWCIAEIFIQNVIIGLLILCLKQNRWNERTTK